MTAIIGVMNKQGIAIAADSAVTIQNHLGRKIFNHANKIFTLSKFHPIGIMIYNSASFMSVPWEVIIKLYRNNLKDIELDTIDNYASSFIQFLRDNNFFINSIAELNYLGNISQQLWNSLMNKTFEMHGPLTDSDWNAFASLLRMQMQQTNEDFSKLDKLFEFESYTYDDFKKYSTELFNNIYTLIPEALIIAYPNIKDDFHKYVYNVMIKKERGINYTGLVFIGYGAKEIYPSVKTLNISMAIDNKLRYFEDSSASMSIHDFNHGGIIPFAQTDVIDTIVTGMDPSLDQLYKSNIDSTFITYKETLISLIEEDNKDVANKIRNIDLTPILQKLHSLNQEIKNNKYISPLINTISLLSKEDLSEVAESLISLTSLKRRMTFSEESVGGPIDVAIISKGDGFIWLKRKHYFDADLNKTYFDKYLKL